MGFLRIALALLGLWAGTCNALPDAVFADGLETPCYGIANDRPGCIVCQLDHDRLLWYARRQYAAGLSMHRLVETE